MLLNLLVLNCFFASSFCKYGGHLLHKSTREVKRLLKSEQTYIETIKQARELFKNFTEVLDNYIDSYETLQIQAWNQSQAEDPFKAYLLVRHVTLGWEDIHLKLIEKKDDLNSTLRMLEEREDSGALPDMRDLNGAAAGLGRIYSYYGPHFAQTVQYEQDLKDEFAILDSFDLALIAKQSVNQEALFDTGYDMLELAEMKEAQTSSELLKKLNLNPRDIQRFRATVKTAHDAVLLKGSIQGLKEFKLSAEPTDPGSKPEKVASADNEHDADFFLEMFKSNPERIHHSSSRGVQRLCRAQGTVLKQTNLKCRLSNTNSHISERLGPFKLEEINRAPHITIIKHMLSKTECEQMIATMPELGQLPGKERARKEWSIKNRWVYENQTSILADLVTRIEAVTGLAAKTSDQSPEPVMCGNYGIGGNYGLHPDYREPSSTLQTPDDNRGITIMTVFSGANSGGSTVWPFLGVAAKPEQGDALMWFNLSEEGEPLVLTHHSACPVIHGDKWIGNKWLSQHAQWNTRQCPRSSYKL